MPFPSINSNSIKIPNNSSSLLQVILQVRRQLELQNEFIIVLISKLHKKLICYKNLKFPPSFRSSLRLYSDNHPSPPSFAQVVARPTFSNASSPMKFT